MSAAKRRRGLEHPGVIGKLFLGATGALVVLMVLARPAGAPAPRYILVTGSLLPHPRRVR